MADVDTSSYPKAALPVSPLDVAGKLGGLQQQQQQIQSGALTIDKQKLDLANQGVSYMTRAFAALGPDAPKEEYLKVGQSATKLFNLPPQMLQEYKTKLDAAPTSKAFFDEIMSTAANHKEMLDYHIGNQQFLSNGQTTQGFRAPGKGGIAANTKPIQIQAPPTAEAIVPGTNEKAMLGAQPPQVAPGSVSSIEPLPLPAVPPQRRPDVSFTAPVVKDNSRITPRGPITGLAPGVVAAQEGETIESVKQSNDLATAANEQKNAKALFGNLRVALKGFTPGPMADYKKLAKSFAISNLPIPESWQKEGGFLDPKSIASQEEFGKVSQQILQSQFKALGGTGTNAALDSVSHTSPNELMSKLGIQGVAAMLEGNQDAISIKNGAWRKWREDGNGVETWPKFNQDFNRNFDPRVFQLKYMSPKERKDYIASIDNPSEAKSFVRAYHHAKANDWIDYSIGGK